MKKSWQRRRPPCRTCAAQPRMRLGSRESRRIPPHRQVDAVPPEELLHGEARPASSRVDRAARGGDVVGAHRGDAQAGGLLLCSREGGETGCMGAARVAQHAQQGRGWAHPLPPPLPTHPRGTAPHAPARSTWAGGRRPVSRACACGPRPARTGMGGGMRGGGRRHEEKGERRGEKREAVGCCRRGSSVSRSRPQAATSLNAPPGRLPSNQTWPACGPPQTGPARRRPLQGTEEQGARGSGRAGLGSAAAAGHGRSAQYPTIPPPLCALPCMAPPARALLPAQARTRVVHQHVQGAQVKRVKQVLAELAPRHGKQRPGQHEGRRGTDTRAHERVSGGK